MCHKVASDEIKLKLLDQYNVDILDQDMHNIAKACNVFNVLSSSYFGRVVLFVEKLPILNEISNIAKSILFRHSFFDKLCDHLSSHDFKAVIAVAPFYGELMQDIHSKYDIPCFTILTDVRGSVHEWLYNNKSTIMAFSQETYDDIMLKDSHKYLTSYSPIRSKFFDDRKSKVERRDELGLDRNKKTILVCFGGGGSTESIEIMQQVRCSEHQYVFVCGNNLYLKNELEQLAKDNHNIIIKGFVSDMHKWMQAADIFINQPSGSATGECMATEGLHLLTSCTDVMAQERPNIDTIRELNIGTVINGYNNIMPIIKDILLDNHSRPAILNNNPTDEALEIILKELHNRPNDCNKDKSALHSQTNCY